MCSTNAPGSPDGVVAMPLSATSDSTGSRPREITAS
jgi:hypothetical protein